MMDIYRTTESTRTFRPLPFPKAFEYFELQQRMHWTHEKIDMVDDCRQFNSLQSYEQQILRNALLMFTQTDNEVAKIYYDYYIPVFKCHTIRMMLGSFANIELIHAAAYDRLNTALGLPDEFYGEFLNVKSMYDKYDYMQNFDISSPQKIALTLAIVSGFIEGIVLFASFAIIVSFSAVRNISGRSNVMFGTGQIVTMSMNDESLHCAGVMMLFHLYVKENDIDMNQLYAEIEANCKIVIENEMNFINTVYSEYELEFLPRESLKKFIIYLVNIRLIGLGLPQAQIDNLIDYFKQKYNMQMDINKHPLPWMEERYKFHEVVNFFETTSTAYNKGLKIDAWD